ncbi:MAG TPA: hypothetical protein VNT75_33055 [Symbiobacteriaceae bacterium]|nr:hypothetical protein [Symbiobacteriaceae bacterium]
MTKGFHPLWSALRALGMLMTGQLRFPKGEVGQTRLLADGSHFVIFRQAVVAPGSGQPAKPGAVFTVRFHVAGMTLKQNIRFSVLPMWFIIGLPGFRSKYWGYIRETGDFQGLYEWETVAHAEAYANSFAMRFMTRRSVPGSVSWSINEAARPA